MARRLAADGADWTLLYCGSRAGTVWINTYKQFSIATPFGGTKHSGLGIEKGRHGIRTFSRSKSLFLGLAEEPLGWAEPVHRA
jgi:betaine-aldehyde dehydrogenase